MRAKTKIVVKLVSPGQACEGCEVPRRRIGLVRFAMQGRI